MKGETDIFSKIPKTGYHEEVPEINADEFEKVVRSRRSVRVYEKEKIPDDIVTKCLELALLAPNSSNLQPWEFYWVKTPAKQEQLIKACLSQPAARTAPTLIVVVAKIDAWKENRKRMLETFAQKSDIKVPQSAIDYYQKLVPIVYNQGPCGSFGLIKKVIVSARGHFTPTPRQPTSRSELITWAMKTCALACENLMLSFRAFGYDTCPMEGYDSNMIEKLLGLGCQQKVVMVISAGKRASNGIYGPQVRFDSSLFIKQI